jgi:WD40 repeat protein
VTGGEDGTLRLYDATVRTLTKAAFAAVGIVAVEATQDFIFAGHKGGAVSVWDVHALPNFDDSSMLSIKVSPPINSPRSEKSGSELFLPGHLFEDVVDRIAVTEDEKAGLPSCELCKGVHDRGVHFGLVAVVGHRVEDVSDIKVSPDERYIAVGTHDGVIDIYRIARSGLLSRVGVCKVEEGGGQRLLMTPGSLELHHALGFQLERALFDEHRWSERAPLLLHAPSRHLMRQG